MTVLSRLAMTSLTVGCVVLATSTAVWLSTKALDWYVNGELHREEDLKIEMPAPAVTTRSERLERIVMVPAGCVGIVIGREGRTMRQIESETQTVLDFAFTSPRRSSFYGDRIENDDSSDEGDTEKPPKPDAPLHIYGETERRVDLAEMAVRAIIAEELKPKQVGYMDVPSEAVGFIIGKRGDSVRSINERCRVNIRISQNGGELEEAVIRGSEHGIDLAKDIMKKRIDAYFNKFANQNRPMMDNNNRREELETSPEEHLKRCYEVMQMANADDGDEEW